MTRKPVFTVGHSNHPIDKFVALLKRHGVSVIADVRSSPFSRHNPQFNREDLKIELKNAGIKYVFLGHELGARSENPADYDGDKVSYARLASRSSFRAGIDRVLAGSEAHTIALMCAEKEPLDCHRAILVAQALISKGAAVEHILGDGSTETHNTAISRLVKQLVPPTGDLFEQDANPIAEALRIREQQIAYVRPGEAV